MPPMVWPSSSISGTPAKNRMLGEPSTLAQPRYRGSVRVSSTTSGSRESTTGPAKDVARGPP
jgi:hypothetical protein